MKLRNLIPSALQASKKDNLGVTLFLNKNTGTVCYRDTDGSIVEVGEDTAVIATVDTGYTYTEVAVSSAEILTLGTVGKELLPAAGPNNYYDIAEMVLEYTHVTTGYTIGSQLAVYGTSQTYAVLEETLITTGADLVTYFRGAQPTSVATTTPFLYNEEPNANVTLFTVSGANPTLGDGTLLVKIWYKVRTFGTEL